MTFATGGAPAPGRRQVNSGSGEILRESGGKCRVGRIREGFLREAEFELVLRGSGIWMCRDVGSGPCPHVLTFSKWFKPFSLLTLPGYLT